MWTEKDLLPEPHHDPPRHVLDCPEVQGEEEGDGHKVPDKVVREPVAQQVHCTQRNVRKTSFVNVMNICTYGNFQ